MVKHLKTVYEIECLIPANCHSSVLENGRKKCVTSIGSLFLNVHQKKANTNEHPVAKCDRRCVRVTI
jgi:hypothetical protein